MVSVSKDNIISLNRGDTIQLPIFLNSGSDLKPVRYDLHEKDELYFGVMEPNQPFEHALLRKKFTTDSPKDKKGFTLIRIEHEDTRSLIPGKYFYQIKLRKYDDLNNTYSVMTVVGKTLFLIME